MSQSMSQSDRGVRWIASNKYFFCTPDPGCRCFNPYENLRIYHECEGRIEKYVSRIVVWHHKACRVMTNCDPEGQIFLSYLYTNDGFFFLAHHCFYLFIYSFILR